MMTRTKIAAAALFCAAIFCGQALAEATKRPLDAQLYIGWPNNGEVVRGPNVKIWFGLRNMGVGPAGTDMPNVGHHHVILDADIPDASEPIPNDSNHLHFGKGQTEAVLTLSKGVHTIQLNFADKDHMQFDPPLVSKKIRIRVK